MVKQTKVTVDISGLSPEGQQNIFCAFEEQKEEDRKRAEREEKPKTRKLKE